MTNQLSREEARSELRQTIEKAIESAKERLAKVREEYDEKVNVLSNELHAYELQKEALCELEKIDNAKIEAEKADKEKNAQPSV